MTRSAALFWLVPGVVALSCTAQNVTATIEGEPICPDFEIGAARTKMKGGLRKPVQVSVLEDPDDDDDPLSARTLLGRRTADASSPPLLVQDANETYTIRWAQCENERAPRPVKAEKRGASQVAAYQCGEAKTYHKTELEVRKGDPSSRVIEFVAPPVPECWTDTVPAGAEPDAGAEPSASASSAPEADAATSNKDGAAASPPPATAKPGAP